MTETFPIYWIPIIPLAVGCIILACADRLSRSTAWTFSLSSFLLAGFVSVWAFIERLLPLLRKWGGLPQAARFGESSSPRVLGSLGSWIKAGRFEMPFGFQMDALAALSVGLVLVISLSVLFYFGGLRWARRVWVRQLGALTFISGSVLTFLLADNLGLAFAAWVLSGAGVTILVGTGILESRAPEAARSTWLIARLGDVMLLLALLVALVNARSLLYEDLEKTAWLFSHPERRWMWNLKPGFIFTALLAGGILCRSAQFPFHLWLAQGSKGTSVATAVLLGLVAPMGVYLILRLDFLVARSPVPLVVMSCIAGVSSLLMALAASAQHTLRKTVGYLGGAQIGVALTVVGVGGYTVGLFHLIVMSIAATGMALACGSVEHNKRGVSDLRELGGLLGEMPRTGSAFLLTGVTLAGLWPLAGGASTVLALERVLLFIARRTPGIVRLQPNVAAKISWVLFFVVGAAILVASFSSLRLFFRLFTGRKESLRKYPEKENNLLGKDDFSGSFDSLVSGEHRELRFLLWLVPLFLGVLAAAFGLFWGLTGYGVDSGGFVDPSGVMAFSKYLSPSFSTHGLWAVRETFSASGADSAYWAGLGSDMIVVGGMVRVVLTIVVLAGVLGAMGVALSFFKGQPNPLGGRLISSPRYRWFYYFIHRDLGVGFVLRFWSERLLPSLGWLQRSVGERLLVDFFLTRIPVSVVQGVGWLGMRIQRWRTSSSLAISVIGLAGLLALAVRPAHSIEVTEQGNLFLLRVEGVPSAGTNLPWKARWDLNGDGRWNRDGLEIKHSFPRPGAYDITVKVRDLRWGKLYKLRRRVEVRSSGVHSDYSGTGDKNRKRSRVRDGSGLRGGRE